MNFSTKWKQTTDTESRLVVAKVGGQEGRIENLGITSYDVIYGMDKQILL